MDKNSEIDEILENIHPDIKKCYTCSVKYNSEIQSKMIPIDTFDTCLMCFFADHTLNNLYIAFRGTSKFNDLYLDKYEFLLDREKNIIRKEKKK